MTQLEKQNKPVAQGLPVGRQGGKRRKKSIEVEPGPALWVVQVPPEPIMGQVSMRRDWSSCEQSIDRIECIRPSHSPSL